MFIESFDGTKLFLNKEVTPADKAVAVIVHGLAEHSGRYDYLAQKFHESGIGTYRFDHRGHGQSEGERTYYEKYTDMLQDIDGIVTLAQTENPGKPVFMVGHSMGGFGTSLYGAKYPNKGLAGIVLSGAKTNTHGGIKVTPTPDMDAHTKFPNALGAGVCSVPEVVDWYAKDPLNAKTYTLGLLMALQEGLKWFVPNMKEFTYPVLAMHGEADGLVDVQCTYDFFKGCGSTDKQMKIYGGLYHEIFNEYCKDEVIGDAIRWILNRC